jgi:hypothetical protein
MKIVFRVALWVLLWILCILWCFIMCIQLCLLVLAYVIVHIAPRKHTKSTLLSHWCERTIHLISFSVSILFLNCIATIQFKKTLIRYIHNRYSMWSSSNLSWFPPIIKYLLQRTLGLLIWFFLIRWIWIWRSW